MAVHQNHAARALPIVIPPDATDVVLEGPRPFVTRISYRTSDGREVRWAVRERRKTQHRKRGLTWWIGLLFVIGSTCFVLGPVPAYEKAVGDHATALTYFVGSLFFTSAAYLSYLQVVRSAGRRWLDVRLAVLPVPGPGRADHLAPRRDRVRLLPRVLGDRLRRGGPPLVLLATGQA